MKKNMLTGISKNSLEYPEFKAKISYSNEILIYYRYILSMGKNVSNQIRKNGIIGERGIC